MTICWDFPLLGSSSKKGINDAAITMFKGSGDMDGLVREICQNSLDARRKDLPDDEPVKISFDLSMVKRDEHDLFDGFEEAVDGAIDYWIGNPIGNEDITGFLDHIKHALKKDEIPVLVMSDFGTYGLRGVDPEPGETSYWDVLVDTEGISLKDDKGSAGSFGIGKNAPFAYSAFNMVFYNTYATDGGRAFQGVTHLVTTQLEIEGRKLPASDTGKYLSMKDQYTFAPIRPSDSCSFAQIPAFQRCDYGTDVAIVGFKEDQHEDWERQIAIALIKNFVTALIDGKLEASVSSPEHSYEIKSDNLESLLYRTFGDEPQLKYTRQIFETVTGGSEKTVRIAEDGDLTIYTRYEDGYVQSMSRFRSAMLINTTSESLPHFSVVVVVNNVGDGELNEILKDAEPPQHTEWRGKWIVDDQPKRNRANRYLRKIKKEVQEILDDYDRSDIAESMDAGVGGYLPDATDQTGLGSSNDGLRKDVKIKEISSKKGQVLYENEFQSASSSTGSKTDNKAGKRGKRIRRKKTGGSIRVVKPGSGGSSGVSAGKGKVRAAIPGITEHRTFLVGGSRYKLHVDVDRDYENVYISYNAGRDDSGEDMLMVADYKQEGKPLVKCESGQIGPITLNKGGNDIFLGFTSNETLAVSPTFSMEVKDGD